MSVVYKLPSLCYSVRTASIDEDSHHSRAEERLIVWFKPNAKAVGILVTSKEEEGVERDTGLGDMWCDMWLTLKGSG